MLFVNTDFDVIPRQIIRAFPAVIDRVVPICFVPDRFPLDRLAAGQVFQKLLAFGILIQPVAVFIQILGDRDRLAAVGNELPCAVAGIVS